MRIFYLTGLAVIGLAGCSPAGPVDTDPDGPVITIADFEGVEGEDWTGTLTYLDYSSDKRVTIPTAATVRIASPTTIKYTVSYPEEPWEDTKAKLKISKSGRFLDGHPITSREVQNFVQTRDSQSESYLEIRTVHDGEDNNLPAVIRMTYVLGTSKFAIEKDVLLEGETDFVNRNVYVFTRGE